MSRIQAARRSALGLLLVLCVALAAGEPTHWAENGVAVVEVEHLLPAKGWALERAWAGHSGAGYIADTGGGSSLTVWLVVPHGGRYRIALRNRHDHPDHTLENDCWLSVNGSTPTKTFSSIRAAWTWQTRLEYAKGRFGDPIYDLDAGLNQIAISGRSSGFRIDRMHIAREGSTGLEDAALPETAFIPAPPADALPVVQAAWTRGELGKALLAARKAGAERTAASLEEIAGRRRAVLAEARREEPERAAELLALWARSWRGSDLGTEMEAEAAVWAKDPAARQARTARLAYESLAAAAEKMLARRAAGGSVAAGEQDAVVRALGALAERQPATPVAARARRLAERLAGGK